MKTIVLLISVILMAFGLQAQERGGRHHNQEMEKRMEELKTEKVAFLTEKLNLLPETAEKFFPLYNEYGEKRMELGRKKGQYFRAYRKIDEKSSEELEKLADGFIERQVKEAELIKLYHEKFKKILTAEQVFKLYMAEEEFHKRLLNRIREFKKDKRRGDQPLKDDDIPQSSPKD